MKIAQYTFLHENNSTNMLQPLLYYYTFLLRFAEL